MYTKYFPIASFNLSYYFRTGLLTPTSYIDRRNEDLQSNFENSLFFSSEIYPSGTDCSLEIVLTNDEYNQLNNISDHFSLFDSVLPISRVKNIFFKEKSQMEKTVWNIRDGAAFIPNDLIVVSKNGELHSIEEVKKVPGKGENPIYFSDKLELFDRLMGGFALMRSGGESWMNFSKNYFPSISLFNQNIEKEWENSTIAGENKYEWLILQKDSHKNFAKEAVFSDVSMDLVDRYAKRENLNLEKKLGVIQLDSIGTKTFTYLAAILAIYGETGRKKIDDFITYLITSDLELDRKEGIALMFGINKGYKAFRNRYKTEDFEVDVKFKLDSQLDYYIIESIYQYVFNGKSNNNSFPYIDEWCSKLSTKSQDFSNYETDRILDQIVIYKKKVAIGSPEYFQELYQFISPNNIYNKIIESINKWMPPFFKTERIDEGSQFFENELKEDFETIIKSIYENIKNDLIENSTDKTENLKTELKGLQKKHDELVLVNQDLINQIEGNSKEEKSLEIEKFPHLNSDRNIDESENVNPEDEFVFPEEIIKKEHQDLKVVIQARRKLLEGSKMGDLRIIATNLGILRVKDLKGKDGKKELINEIINLEFSNQEKE